MNDPTTTQDTSMPIREICFPSNNDDASELTTLLTHTNHNLHHNGGGGGGDDHLPELHRENSHRLSHPSHPTNRSEESHTTRKAFQLATVLGILSLCALLYTDVLVNRHSADDSVTAVVAVGDQWDALPAQRDSTGVRGGRLEEARDGKKKKRGVGDKVRVSSAKATKKRNEEEEDDSGGNNVDDDYDDDGKQKKAKTGKVPKTSKNDKVTGDDDDGDGDDTETNDDDDENDEAVNTEGDNPEVDTTTMNDDDDLNQMIYVNPQKNVHQEPKLIPSDVIAAATTIDDSKISQYIKQMEIPIAQKRCPYVIQTFEDQNVGASKDFLREKYIAQSADANTFYRATALLFWKDFGARRWGEKQGKSINLEELVLLGEAKYQDGTPLSPMSTWTWITGDQHLSNFGAWRNRGGDVVFSVNDFDEAAIYDFQLDVLRIAVSICNHGFTNGLSVEEVSEALETFTFSYVKTAIEYVGGDAALLYELTEDTSTGVLRDFLSDVEKNKSQDKQLEKFTETGKDGARRFVYTEDNRLVNVPKELENKIRSEMVSTKYGASMMKMGWRVRGWDDDFFTVLDIARRVGSGIGSYGVDRFYVLLKGTDTSLDEDGDSSVILDIKYEPISAVSRVLDENTRAWYAHMFRNEADRTAQAQRRLTSFTDPYVGWIEIDGNPYYVRQRSPWKSSFALDELKNHNAFVEFMEQIAIATATSHVRGTVSKSPGQFKHVIKVLLAGDRNRRRWSNLVAKIAFHYRNQVLLDYECFKSYVKQIYPLNNTAAASTNHTKIKT
eukprot:CCRYP_011547-RA/>CCRYP_011547-RA protein AED:0.29 eAED:0.29 QI:352/1/1/1/0.33/0.28/7/151/780